MALLWISHLCSPVVAVDGIILGEVENEEGRKDLIEEGSGDGHREIKGEGTEKTIRVTKRKREKI
jgi:hypothetical protein